MEELDDAGKSIVGSLTEAQNALWSYTVYDDLGWSTTRQERLYNRIKERSDMYPNTLTGRANLLECMEPKVKKFIKEEFIEDSSSEVIRNDKMERFGKARDDGIRMAYKIYKEQGFEKLWKYSRTKINTDIAKKEIELVTPFARDVVNECCILNWLIALHEEGIGSARLSRIMDRFQDKHACLDEGYVSFKDILNLMNPKLKHKLSDSWLMYMEHYNMSPEELENSRFSQELIVQEVVT